MCAPRHQEAVKRPSDFVGPLRSQFVCRWWEVIHSLSELSAVHSQVVLTCLQSKCNKLYFLQSATPAHDSQAMSCRGKYAQGSAERKSRVLSGMPMALCNVWVSRALSSAEYYCGILVRSARALHPRAAPRIVFEVDWTCRSTLSPGMDPHPWMM
jgi:hypothetical protein